MYVLDNAGDVVVESSFEGVDIVFSTVTYTLGQFVEMLTLTGTQSISGFGNDLDNVLIGNSGQNTLRGGLGNDIYVVQTGGDSVWEASDAGIDQVQSSVSWTLSEGIESLILFGTAAVSGLGNDLDNFLQGNAANNALSGGGGADVLRGGAGNDTYSVDNVTDGVFENAHEGIDSVSSLVDFSLGEYVENLTLTGSVALVGFGNGLGNSLSGNSAVNTLVGGAGDDVYVVQNPDDVVVEELAGGTDSVLSSVSWTLSANIENLTLAGTTSIAGVGNGLDNTLTGNAGTNTLAGGLGNDTYVVQNTTDVVSEAAQAGSDTVISILSYTLGANVEHLVLSGTAAINATGNSLANSLVGSGGANTLSGGAGDDTYVVAAGDLVIELTGQGLDVVQSTATWTLSAELEHLVLNGTAAISGTGNAVSNVMTGNLAANTLDGAAGADTLVGAQGDDVYIVDNVGDVIIEEESEGADSVQSIVSYSLIANLEALELIGTSAIDGVGNRLDNTLTGNSAVNTLAGGLGNDRYVVQNVADVVIEAPGGGVDTVVSSVSWTLGAHLESVQLAGSGNINAVGNTLSNTLQGNVGVNTLVGGLGDDTYVVASGVSVTVEGVDEGVDSVHAGISYSLAANTENLTLTGSSAISGTGNTQNNVLTGNSGINTLSGGGGDDTYVVQNGSDALVELLDEGVDSVQADVSFTLSSNLENLTLTGTASISAVGNSIANTLLGNSGNNVLDGAAGADTMRGGAGDDVYLIDSIGDVVIEDLFGGTDSLLSSVTLTLGAEVENLTLIGTSSTNAVGNSIANVLGGNVAVNMLSGGQGDDTYIVQNSADTVVEALDEGNDSVQSVVDYTLSANVENLILSGTANLTATGNALSNALIGNAGNNLLLGGVGDDVYDGSLGVDTVSFANAANSVTVNLGVNGIQATGEGADVLVSIENLIGSAFADTLVGSAGDNRLEGRAGNDVLDGGTGTDTVVYENASAGVVVNLATSTSQNTGDGLDTLVSIENIAGSSFNDTLVGNAGNNVFHGGGGDDVLNGGTGSDTASYVSASGGVSVNLQIVGTQNTGQGSDSLVSIENLVGSAFSDTFTGTSGNNTFEGGLGNDVFVSGGGQDAVSYANESTGVTVSLAIDTSQNTGAGLDTISSAGGFVFGSVIGSAFNDTLTARASGSTLRGGLGDDTLLSALGNDTLDGGSGTDTASYVSAGAAVVVTLAITTTQATGAGSDLLTSIENLVGSAFNDTLTGSTGNNTIEGGLGNDVIDGAAGVGDWVSFLSSGVGVTANLGVTGTQNTGQGLDTITNFENLIGSAFNDTLTGVNGVQNVLVGGGGDDIINGSPDGADYASYQFSANGVSIDLAIAGPQITGEGTDTLVSIHLLYGSNFNDTLLGNSNNNWLRGNAGDDYIDGRAGLGDTFLAGTGAQLTIDLGMLGAQNTGEGFDTLLGIENIWASSGDDTLLGNGSNNKLWGHAGNDYLDGKDGIDEAAYSGVGATVDLNIVGAQNTGQGIDTFVSIENLAGGGGAFSDTFIGNAGANTLSGSDGDDLLDGRAGLDRLVGGNGNDRFVFGRDYQQDTINDTSGNDDRIVLGSDISKNDLWLWQSGSDLKLGIVNTNDSIHVEGWFSATANQIERIELVSGGVTEYLQSSSVQQLVNAMAGFNPEAQGNLNVDQAVMDSVSSSIAAAWQSA